MKRKLTTTALSCLLLAFAALPVLAQDDSRAVSGGGISVDGWMGKIDAREAEKGQKLENASLAMHGDALHVKTGPAVVYWHKDHTASGNYTVTATFNEPAYMASNNHPHPYGLFIGGANMGADNQSLLYCAAYGDGRFIVRGFSPEAFRVNGRSPESHPAVGKAEGADKPVTQKIAISVTADKVECIINDAVVGSYAKSEVVGEGKLASTDGVYGIRFGHNTEATILPPTLKQH